MDVHLTNFGYRVELEHVVAQFAEFEFLIAPVVGVAAQTADVAMKSVLWLVDADVAVLSVIDRIESAIHVV